MSTSHAFKAGWQDRLLNMPVPSKYEKCRTGLAVAYERGRHCAALYEFAIAQAHRALRTITEMPPVSMVAFTVAYKTMPKELRFLIRAEKKFCSLKPKKWSV